MLSPQEIQAKWSRNMRGATESYKAGVMAVTESPTAKAAAASDKYVSGVQAAVDSGRYQEGLRAVSLTQWQQAAATTGASRLASGVAKGEGKVGTFWQEFAPYLGSVTQRVRSMPSNTVEEREQRMLAQSRGVGQFRRTRR